ALLVFKSLTSPWQKRSCRALNGFDTPFGALRDGGPFLRFICRPTLQIKAVAIQNVDADSCDRVRCDHGRRRLALFPKLWCCRTSAPLPPRAPTLNTSVTNHSSPSPVSTGPAFSSLIANSLYLFPTSALW